MEDEAQKMRGKRSLGQEKTPTVRSWEVYQYAE